jgi:hypothetical protein
MVKIEPALPIQSMLPALPMLRIEPALPMLRMEPALPMLKTEPTLPMLAMQPRLPMLIMLNRLFTLRDLTRVLPLALGDSTRFRPERVAPYIHVPLRTRYLFARHISRRSVPLPPIVLNAATCRVEQGACSP